MNVSGPTVDLADPTLWQLGVPHEAFDAERAEAPVRWRTVDHQRHGMVPGSGYWSITGYDEVRTALHNPTVFSSHDGGIRMEDPSGAGLYSDRLTIVGMDPPVHGGYRLAVNRNFVPRVIERLRQRVTTIAADAVDRLATDVHERSGPTPHTADLVARVSAEVPLLVIADLLGVEPSDRDRFRQWTDIVVSPDDPDVVISRAEVIDAVRAFMAYGAEVLADRRAHPQDDLMTAIASAEVAGEPMDDAHQAAMWFIFLIGGNETTRNALTGAAIAFDHFPEQLHALQSGERSWAEVSEEVLRWWSPVNYLRRTVHQDTELGGVPMQAGDKVMLWLTAANRDPLQFIDPHRFDLSRSNAGDHLALGHGTHFCLGAHLARLELEVTLPLLYARLPDLQLTTAPTRVRANFINGVSALSVSSPSVRAANP
ncbi:MAG: cytochrome P450 [Acidimicrobiales bacterium]